MMKTAISWSPNKVFITRHCPPTSESHGSPQIPTKQASLWAPNYRTPTYRPTTSHETHTTSHWTPNGQCHTSSPQT